MDGQTSFDWYRMSDALWKLLKPFLPGYKVNPRGGRPRRNLRCTADAIFYRLRTGCQWKAIPITLAPGSTAHAYFQEWEKAGVFDGNLDRRSFWWRQEFDGLNLGVAWRS